MKKIIRQGVFESNSSSSHSLSITTQEKWNEFKTTDKYLAEWDGTLCLVDDLIEEMKKAAEQDVDIRISCEVHNVDFNDRASCIKYLTRSTGNWSHADYFTYENWGGWEWSDWAESDVTYFETPSGDKMVAIAAYGYNG